MEKNDTQSTILIETSWEVCNKIGGIYTVLSTKAATLEQTYGERLVFVGPDVWTAETPSPTFIEETTPLSAWAAQAELPEGVTVRTGRWAVPGRPLAVLVGFSSMFALNDEFYGRMWQKYGVDSLHSYGDYGEACAFSHAAGAVVVSLARYMARDGERVVAHFDEWTTAAALLYVRSYAPEVATVFTTHATSIGRSICGNNKPLYDYLRGYNGDQMAGELNMEAKHSLEKAAAHRADCFTTVSDVTGRECCQLLDRCPDVVTPNGFEADFVPGPRKLPSVRRQARRKMLEVASALTGLQYPDNTFIVVSSGRCEYRNKGLDMLLDVAETLRHRITRRRILIYIMVPAWSAGPRADLQQNLSEGLSRRLPDPVTTHALHTPQDDAIMSRIHQLGLQNDACSSVSVVYVPCYLNGDDGIFDMPYYSLLPGADATVFPSYYEPWGYTPLESVAFGVPTITTSLSGFGQWVRQEGLDGFGRSGVEVAERTDGNYHEATNSIASRIEALAAAPETTTKKYALAARQTAARAAWEQFIPLYFQAYKIALANARRRLNSTNN